ncbi:MAG: acyl-CoA dehydrogenase family protein [Myxococcota bacterium]
MIHFGHDEDTKLLVDTVRSFGEKEIRPRLREFEAAGALTPSLEKAYAELGIAALSLPSSVGGSDMGERTEVLVGEELGYADLGTSYALPGPGAFGLALRLLGSEAQQARWLKDYAADGTLRGAVAYSEKPNPEGEMQTRAVRSGGGWVLSGAKSHVLHAPRARHFVVFARVEGEGLGAFVVERAAKGLTVGEKLGVLAFDAAGIAPITLQDVKVSDDARLTAGGDFAVKATELFVRAALRSAARLVGGARASYVLALEYAQTRKTFGKPIGHHQALGFLLADMATAVDSMRWMVWRAAAALDDNDENAILEACKAVAEVQETAMWVTNQGVQVHGGAGFIQDLPVEKWMREAKAAMSYAMTSQHADELVADAMLNPDEARKLLRVPSPTLQPVLL